MSQLGLARLGPRIFLQYSLHIILLFINPANILAGVPKSSEAPLQRNSTAENALLACYNKGFNVNGTSFDEYLHGDPTRSLRLHRVWWSARSSNFSFSFFTPADLSRIGALEAQCESLPDGIVVAAIWLPLYVKSNAKKPPPPRAAAAAAAAAGPGIAPEHLPVLNQAVSTLEALYRRIETSSPPPQRCVLRLMLLYELVSDPSLTLLMPVNAIRNAAMLATDTRLVSMVDVDLSVCVRLSRAVLSLPERMVELLWRAEKQHVAFVMPAWDPSHHVHSDVRNKVANIAVHVALEEKYRLRDMWMHRRVLYPFAMERGYMPGHNATNYDKWFMVKEDYPIEYQEGYEPWYIAARKVMPMYDARFRGYYMNKLVATRHASHTMHLRVLHDVWVVHRPHETQVSSYGWYIEHNNASITALEEYVNINGSRVLKRDAFFETNRAFYQDAVKHMRHWTYEPHVDAAARHCRDVLPWWGSAGCS